MILSSAERFAVAGSALLIALHAAVAGGMIAANALELRPDLAWREPWRLLTGHFVHINWPHVLVNAAGWLVVARLLAAELPALRQAWLLPVAALVIGVGLTQLLPTLAWYRGFSGVLHALFFAGTVQWLTVALRAEAGLRGLWLPVLLLIGGTLKVVAEQPADGATPFAEWLGAGTVPQAHLLGALVGALVGAVVGRAGGTAAQAPGEASE